jgi:hypothetical protein
MVVAGGCYGESGPSGQGRKFLNDVWTSADGSHWEQITSNASWSPRSGARLVVFGGKLILVAGEVGFTPDTQAWLPLLHRGGEEDIGSQARHRRS